MISSQQTCNFKPMQISRQMPQKVADVAKMLNAMKLDSDPCHGMCMELVSPTSRMEMEGMLRKTDALVGIRGKRILEIGCGPVSGKASVFTDALEKLKIEPERYVGVDPSIMYMPGYGSGKIAYVPFSFYSSDFMGLETLGKFDIVFSAAFFGIPVSHLGSKVMRMALDVIQGQARGAL